METARGFKPPLFVDIRISRSVLAKGFRGGAFEEVVGSDRYLWMDSLGNLAILLRTGPPIQINIPSAAERLLDLAIDRVVQGQRLLFFCACEFPQYDGKLFCHRLTVANLILKAARRRNQNVQIVEWPGGTPETFDLAVPASEFRKLVASNKRRSIPLTHDMPLARYAQVPWGSIINVQSEGNAVPVVTGPARYSTSGWYLPIPWNTVDRDVTLADLQRQVPKLRRDRGYDALEVQFSPSTPTTPGLYEYCIYTIAHLDKLKGAMKDGEATFVEHRRWTTGLKLLHAANKANLELPILFGDANDCTTLLYWGVLRDIKIEGNQTIYRFDGLQKVPARHPT